MTNQYYKSVIEFSGDTLKVEVTYDTQVTDQEDRETRQYFQWRCRERGQEVSLDQIRVTPTAGDVTKRTTVFVTRLDKPLYAGLPLLHQRVPYVLPLVIVDLKKFAEQKTPLTPYERRLLNHTVNGLENIVGGNADV